MAVRALLVLSLILAMGCQALVFSPRSPDPQFTVSPQAPCIGDTVSVVGSGFQGREVSILIFPPSNRNPTVEKLPIDESSAITIATVQLDNSGAFNITFVLSQNLGRTSTGQLVTIEAGRQYAVNVKYGNEGGSLPIILGGQQFTVCQP